jgi:hypothetical protein
VSRIVKQPAKREASKPSMLDRHRRAELKRGATFWPLISGFVHDGGDGILARVGSLRAREVTGSNFGHTMALARAAAVPLLGAGANRLPTVVQIQTANPQRSWRT